MDNQLLSDEEVQQIILAFLYGNGPSTPDETMRAIKWAERVRTDELILELVLEGKMFMGIFNEEIGFTTEGRKK